MLCPSTQKRRRVRIVYWEQHSTNLLVAAVGVVTTAYIASHDHNFISRGLGWVHTISRRTHSRTSNATDALTEATRGPFTDGSLKGNGLCHGLKTNLYLLACAAFGACMIFMARQSRPHQYQEFIYFASVALGSVGVVIDVWAGSALPSSIFNVLPILLLCGQLTNMGIGMYFDYQDEGDDVDDERLSSEKR